MTSYHLQTVSDDASCQHRSCTDVSYQQRHCNTRRRLTFPSARRAKPSATWKVGNVREQAKVIRNIDAAIYSAAVYAVKTISTHTQKRFVINVTFDTTRLFYSFLGFLSL